MTLSLGAGSITPSVGPTVTINSWTVFPSNNTISIDLTGLETKQYLFSLVVTGLLTVQFVGKQPQTISAKGTLSYVAGAERIAYPSSPLTDLLCLDYTSVTCQTGGGGGSGGGPLVCISCLVEAVVYLIGPQGIPWLIGLVTLVSIPLLIAGVIVERRKK